MHTCVYLLRVHMTKNTYMYKIHICICKYTPGLSRCIFTRGCIFAHVQINFYIYAIAFTCPKIHPGANYTYMYNLHTACKSAHVNGALDDVIRFRAHRVVTFSRQKAQCLFISRAPEFSYFAECAYTNKGPRRNKTLVWSVPDRT